jgi:Fanconi anemia group M protein
MPSKLFDIFSKKKIRKEVTEKTKAIIDYREKNALVSSELVELGMEIEFRELKVGDYLVNNVAIERKTVSDFINSMINKRLIRQLQELSQYEDRLLIIEGIDEQELYSDNFSDDRVGMHPNAIRGFLLSVLLKFKTPIIYTKDYRDTAKFIYILSKKEKRESSLNVKKKSFNKKEQKQFIVESFPGIGPKTAKKLLENFKSIKNLMNSPNEEVQKVIGKKGEIFKLVDESY